MKNIFRTILSIMTVFGGLSAFANSELATTINASPLETSSTIAVSVKEANTGKVLYQHNEKKLLHPASTLKIFTTIPAMEELGDDYEFTTTFYTANNNLYIKAGADPFLTQKSIKDAIRGIKGKGYHSFNKVYFDGSIIDSAEWGIGWMWDDTTNKRMQKFSAYNIDNNLVNIEVTKDENGTVTAKPDIAMPVINTITAGDKNDIFAIRQDWTSPDVILVSGTTNSPLLTISVPINNIKRYYQQTVMNNIKKAKITLQQPICLEGKVPENAKIIAEIKNPIKPAYDKIFKDSDNLCAETVGKIAGGQKAGETGAFANQSQLFYNYWNANGVDTKGIVVADASGVSRNNLLTVDFMTNALNKIYVNKQEEFIKDTLAQPGEGTFSNRLLNYRGYVFLKSGTLANVSGLVGYVKADSGKTYSVAILIQNFTYPERQVKIFENRLIEEIKKM